MNITQGKTQPQKTKNKAVQASLTRRHEERGGNFVVIALRASVFPCETPFFMVKNE